MHDFTYYAQILISGLTIGSLYALIAIGYTMVYGILRLINFAHGDMFMVAGFIMIYITSWSSGFLGAGSIAVGLILTLILTVVLGVMIEKVAYKPLRSAPRMSVMISAIGVRNVVENKVDFTKSRNLIIAATILVCGLGFSSGLTFQIAGTSITLTGLAIAAIMGVLLNAILPGREED